MIQCFQRVMGSWIRINFAAVKYVDIPCRRGRSLLPAAFAVKLFVDIARTARGALGTDYTGPACGPMRTLGAPASAARRGGRILRGKGAPLAKRDDPGRLRRKP